MGKTVTKIEDTVVSLAKAMPLIAGATIGIARPLLYLKDGDWGDALQVAEQNFAFYDPATNTFSTKFGTGIKGLAAGLIGSKIIKWIANE